MNFASSLDILNRAMLGVMSSYLLDTMKFDVNSVVYTPDHDDIDNDLTRLRETSADPNVSVWPGLVVSRGNIAKELAEKSQSWKFVAVFNREKEINYRLVNVEYPCRVYTQTAEECEFLTNQLLILNPTKVMFEYDVPWLEPQQLKCVMMLKVPGIETRIVSDDQRKIKGQVYCMTMVPTVRALLVDVPEKAPIVKRINYSIYDTTAQVKMAGVIINSVPGLQPN